MTRLTNQINGIIKKTFESPKVLRGEICSNIIQNELKADKPSMIGRFGSTEIKAVLYPNLPFRKKMKKRIFSILIKKLDCKNS